MKQNFLQKIANQSSKFFYKEPKNNLDDDREKNLACKSALEKLGKSTQKEFFKKKDMDYIIAYYGMGRVTNILSNSASFFKEGEITEGNKLWSDQYPSYAQLRHWGRSEEFLKNHVPDSSEDFALESSSSFVNWAMEKVQGKEEKQKFVHLRQYDSLEKMEETQDLKGKVLAISPTAMKNPLAKDKSQLWIALEGDSESEQILARNIKTGAEMKMNRSMILGVVHEDALSEKVKKKVQELFPVRTKEEEIFENARPFLGNSKQEYRTVSLKSEHLLVAERTKNNEIHFSTWVMEHNVPSHKHDFGTDWENAKQDFGIRTGLIKQTPIISLEEYQKAKESEITLESSNLSEEEMALFLKLSAKLKGETVKEAVESAESQDEEISQESELVKEWDNEKKEKDVFREEHCEPSGEQEELEGKILVLSQNNIKEEFISKESQLWLALAGAGLSSMEKGEDISAVNLHDGEKGDFQRDDFLGALKEEWIPEWAAESKLVLEPSLLEQEDIFKKGATMPFPCNGTNRILQQIEDTVLLATKTQGEIKFTVCNLNYQEERVTPLSSTSNDLALIQEKFQEVVALSQGTEDILGEYGNEIPPESSEYDNHNHYDDSMLYGYEDEKVQGR